MKTCRGVLGYTNDDDGVWLECDWRLLREQRCGFRKNLGHWATVDEVIAAEREHLESK